ncbi:MAG: DUF523 and DUF1722 domain-containing protein [Candidatus Thermoplasmatota archaeon]|nr:DUF523 and DUF1722 domain-containing protein [Candidatus Thermoplasmatota archaeon]
MDPHDGKLLRLGVSACLLGENVRWNGGNKNDRVLVHDLSRYVEWVPICPEMEIGLGTPRPPIRLVDHGEGPRLVQPDQEIDLTDLMETWTQGFLDALEGPLHGWVLQETSPTCAPDKAKVYHPGGHVQAKSPGTFARRVKQRYPHLPMIGEGRLNHPELREAFLDHAMAMRRWTDLVASAPSLAHLTEFHARHKFTLMSHAPEGQRHLGRIVADASGKPMDEVLHAYQRQFGATMAKPATRGKHANTLQHIQGFVKDHLDPNDTRELTHAISDYHAGLVPLVVPLTLLRHHLRREKVDEWVLHQTYLDPYPREWMLRNHI